MIMAAYTTLWRAYESSGSEPVAAGLNREEMERFEKAGFFVRAYRVPTSSLEAEVSSECRILEAARERYQRQRNARMRAAKRLSKRKGSDWRINHSD